MLPVHQINPYVYIFCVRYGNFEDFLHRMDKVEGGIKEMAKGYDYFGCHVEEENVFVCRQWAPAAQEMWLMGDFNDWRQSNNQKLYIRMV